MARDLTTAMQAAAADRQVWPVYFVFIDYPADPAYFWSGPYDIVWDSQTWLSAAEILQIGTIGETSDDRDQALTLVLNGINPDRITDLLALDIQGSKATIWKGFLKTDGTAALIDSPAYYFGGVLDVPVINDGTNISISVTVQTGASAMKTKNERRWVGDDQKMLYSTDLGCDFVPQMPSVNLLWGSSGNNGPTYTQNIIPYRPGLGGWVFNGFK